MSRMHHFLHYDIKRDQGQKSAFKAGSVSDLIALGLTPAELSATHTSFNYPFNAVSEIIRQGRSDLLAWIAPLAPAYFSRGFDDPIAEGPSYVRAFAAKPDGEVFGVLMAHVPAAKLRADFAAFLPNRRGDNFNANAAIHELAYSGRAGDPLAAVAAARWLGPVLASLPNLEGVTPLMRAAQAQWADMASELLDLGADAFHENKLGQSAMQCAREWASGDEATFSLFEREGLRAFLASAVAAAPKAPRPRL